MAELYAVIVGAVVGLINDLTILGALLLLAVSLGRRILIRTFLAFVGKVLPFHITFRLRGGSLLVGVRVGGLGLWVWLNTFWERR